MTGDDLTNWPDAQIETAASETNINSPVKGLARAEIKRRQRQHELERDAARRAHEIKMFEAQGNRAALQQEFEERLAREQQVHAEKLAKDQLQPAISSAKATRWAAFAAIASTAAALISVVISLLGYFDAHKAGADAVRPTVDFFTEDDVTEPIVGIQIMNGGSGIAKIDEVRYFLDGKLVGDDQAVMDKLHLDPNQVLVTEFERDDSLSVHEQRWMFYRKTPGAKGLEAFTGLVDNHLDIGVRYRSLDGHTWTKCSTPDQCGGKF